ncbi:MAG: hypothetical protein U0R19_11825 [Bryobacteraceae bacterium]
MANLIWGGDGETGMTDMRAVFDALPGVLRGHDWLVSDAECWRDLGLGGDPVWMTGAELDELIGAEPVQFIWGVFSGVPVGYRVNLEVAPRAWTDDFYRGSPRPRLEGAELEIVCVDSSFCLLIGLSEELAGQFRAAFPGEVDDLDEENRRRLVD